MDEVSPTYRNAQPFDVVGKNRAEIKAQEYERACGVSWRSYQICLKASIVFTFLAAVAKSNVFLLVQESHCGQSELIDIVGASERRASPS